MFTYILVFLCICGIGVELIIIDDLVCKSRLTHKGFGHPFLDELSYWFTTLDGSDTPSVWFVGQHFRVYLDLGSGKVPTCYASTLGVY